MKKIILLILTFFCIFNFSFAKEINIDVFWREKDDNYLEVKEVLSKIEDINIREYNVDEEKNKKAMLVLVDYFKSNLPAVPFLVIGNDGFVYFRDDHKDKLLADIAICKEESCPDITEKVFALIENPENQKKAFEVPPIFYVTGFLTMIVLIILIKEFKKRRNEKNN